MLERLEDPLHVVAVQPGATIADPDEDVVTGARAHELDPGGRRREPESVLEYVDEHPLELRRVDADQRRLVVQGDCDACRLDTHAVERAGDELVDWPQLPLRASCSGFKAGEIEQVRDQALQPGGLEADRLEQLRAIGVAKLERGALET